MNPVIRSFLVASLMVLTSCDVWRGVESSAHSAEAFDVELFYSVLRGHSAYVETKVHEIKADGYMQKQPTLEFQTDKATVTLTLRRSDGEAVILMASGGLAWRPDPSALVQCILLQWDVYRKLHERIKGFPFPRDPETRFVNLLR
jgi:hypothetical protein